MVQPNRPFYQDQALHIRRPQQVITPFITSSGRLPKLHARRYISLIFSTQPTPDWQCGKRVPSLFESHFWLNLKKIKIPITKTVPALRTWQSCKIKCWTNSQVALLIAPQLRPVARHYAQNRIPLRNRQNHT